MAHNFFFDVIHCFFCRAFAPLQIAPHSNSTEWDRIKELFKELGNNRNYFRHIFNKIFSVAYISLSVCIFFSDGEDSISFTISMLTLIGLLLFIVYTVSSHQYVQCAH